MRDKLKIPYPVVVEGKYDRAALETILDATIVTTGGFGIFSHDEQLALLRRLARECGIILLTDSDGAGRVIRSHITSMIPEGRVIQLYTPEVEGKEKRKKEPSKAGLLGVEGIDRDALYRLFEPFADGAPVRTRAGLTKQDFYAAGLSGGEGSAAARARLARALDLPANMSANALLEAINLTCTREEYERAIEKTR